MLVIQDFIIFLKLKGDKWDINSGTFTFITLEGKTKVNKKTH